MKKALKTILLIIFLSFIFPGYSQSIKGFGDSITEGYGTSQPSKNFLNLVSTEKFLTPLNYAVGGSRMFNDCFEPSSFECVNAFTTRRNMSMAENSRDYVTIFYGTNDPQHILDSLDQAPVKWQDHLQRYIQESFLDQGYDNDKIILITLPYNSARNSPYPTLNARFDHVSQMIRQVKNNLNLKLADLWQATYNHPNNEGLTPDLLHLNDEGHRLLADLVNAQIGTLPVNITSFNVNCHNISWTTTNELNIKNFDVQRSIDGKTWQSLGVIYPLANNNYSFSYTSTINAFYRIVETDNDGKKFYSHIEQGKCAERNNFKLNNNHLLSFNKAADVKIYNMAGEVVKEKMNVKEISIADLPQGIYILKLNAEHFKFSKM